MVFCIPADKTCRIWDLRTDKVHKALRGFEDPVTTTTFTPADSHTIYVGTGVKIYTYDLRMESLLLETAQSTRVYDGAQDEINQIQVNHRGTCLAACDDAGDIRVLDLKTHKWMRSLQRQHDNIAMTVQFVPKKDLQALSGGMDKQIVAWDFYKGRPTQLIDTGASILIPSLWLYLSIRISNLLVLHFFISQIYCCALKDTPAPAGVQSKQLFNPPFVHSIAIHPSGTRAAIGLGDGTIQFLNTAADTPSAPQQTDESSSAAPAVSKKSKKKTAGSSSVKDTDGWMVGGRLNEAHGTPIATMYVPCFCRVWV
ncbi:WD repeat-containing protein 53 [Mortierella alpina]|uniref:WD repeat-containing protein 53 n=1 Tax=Mortierella alpina TaxID=64518 RepID=A0A9P6JFH5_MORAP|nr:WD repeat-containing protein 53 [Mortierella alpina]